MTLLDSLKLTKFPNKASYVQLCLFQNKGAALLNDLSPYVFLNIVGSPTNKCLRSGRHGVYKR